MSSRYDRYRRGLGLSIEDPRAISTAPTAMPTYRTTTPGTAAGPTVVVRSPGDAAPAPAAGGVRSPAELGMAIATREMAMTGAATSDKPCGYAGAPGGDIWTVLLFDVACDHALELVYVSGYLEAQRALVALAAAPAPTAAIDRAAYVGLVGAYAWVMSWASGLEDANLPWTGASFTYGNETSPGVIAFGTDTAIPGPYTDGHHTIAGYRRQGPLMPTGLGMARSVGSHPDASIANPDLPITITQLNLNRCNTAAWTGDLDPVTGLRPGSSTAGAGIVVVGVGVSARDWSSEDGLNRVNAARDLASALSTYSLVQMWVDAFAVYSRFVDTWKGMGLPVNIPASDVAQAALGLQHAKAVADTETASAAIVAAGGAAAAIPVVGVVVGLIAGAVAAILKVFTILPSASGAVPCPRPYLYRSSSRSECSGSSESAGGAEHVVTAMNPITASLVAASRAAAAQREIKSFTQPSGAFPWGWALGGAALVGLGIAAFWPRKRR
jgi:hypothetical protein